MVVPVHVFVKNNANIWCYPWLPSQKFYSTSPTLFEKVKNSEQQQKWQQYTVLMTNFVLNLLKLLCGSKDYITYLPNILQLEPQAQQYAIADAKCCLNSTSSVLTKFTSIGTTPWSVITAKFSMSLDISAIAAQTQASTLLSLD